MLDSIALSLCKELGALYSEELSVMGMKDGTFIISDKPEEIKKVLNIYGNKEKVEFLFEVSELKGAIRCKKIRPKTGYDVKEDIKKIQERFVNIAKSMNYEGYVTSASSYIGIYEGELIGERKEEVQKLIDAFGIVNECYFYSHSHPLKWEVARDVLEYDLDIDYTNKPNLLLYDNGQKKGSKPIQVFEEISQIKDFKEKQLKDYEKILEAEARIDFFIRKKGYKVETEEVTSWNVIEEKDLEFSRIGRHHLNGEIENIEYYVLFNDESYFKSNKLKEIEDKILEKLEKELT